MKRGSITVVESDLRFALKVTDMMEVILQRQGPLTTASCLLLPHSDPQMLVGERMWSY